MTKKYFSYIIPDNLRKNLDFLNKNFDFVCYNSVFSKLTIGTIFPETLHNFPKKCYAKYTLKNAYLVICDPQIPQPILYWTQSS